MLNIESENGTSLDNQIENADQSDDERIDSADEHTGVFDFTHVHAIARIAMYDDLRSAPRVTEIKPAPTAEYIRASCFNHLRAGARSRRDYPLHSRARSQREFHPRAIR